MGNDIYVHNHLHFIFQKPKVSPQGNSVTLKIKTQICRPIYALLSVILTTLPVAKFVSRCPPKKSD